ncbi:PTS fructose transporter subunit IIB [Endozoicomonas sp. (ex Bugula neritina AB1)]|nr:PTS fructose transporter subunit IIB [Endozoicomonas sp. (ex Bugula neritina AB1)]
MNIVAVTACPTGIAHTYMAAEKLTDAAMARGHDIKVETQGAMGIENPITESDVEAADVAIFAVDIAIEDEYRFDGLRAIKVPVAEAIRNPEAVMAQLS